MSERINQPASRHEAERRALTEQAESRDRRPAVWFDRGRIITRNADGGTTAWSEEDATTLHRSLGEILAGINGRP